MTNGMILLLMTALFLIFGYMGVPVAFALMAGVLVACALTPISMQSMIGQMFHGIDSEILLAVPFFLLVGELMTSADVTNRMIRLAQTIGIWWLAAIIIGTAFLGTYVIRRVGMSVFERTLSRVSADKEVFPPLFDGFLQVLAGLLLILFLVDMIMDVPFCGSNPVVDVFGILGAGVVLYLAFNAYRDLR